MKKKPLPSKVFFIFYGSYGKRLSKKPVLYSMAFIQKRSLCWAGNEEKLEISKL